MSKVPHRKRQELNPDHPLLGVATTALYQCAYYLEISRSAMRPKNFEAPW
jgi:hypothetical protein